MNPVVNGLSSDAEHDIEQRILILAPRGRDAQVISRVLSEEGLQGVVCTSLSELGEQVIRGAGLAFLCEEVLQASSFMVMPAWLAQQPPWSDFPLIVLASKRLGPRPPNALDALVQLGNVVLLERPLHSETLVSAARAALRARRRQYQARLHLEEQTRIGRDNARLYSAERHARHEAAEAREMLGLALEAAELGTFYCPLPSGTIRWNDSGLAHFWLKDDAHIELDSFFALLHPDDREDTRMAIERAIEQHLPYDMEYRTLSPQGQCRWIRAKGRAYYDADGRPVRFDGITLDISRQKMLAQERETLLEAERAARAEAEYASRMKDEFLATLSHELRTPLGSILGWAHLLGHRSLPQADQQRAVETIERNTRMLSRLIDDLLDMNRIISGHIRLDVQAVRVADVIDAVIASLQPAAAAKSIHLEKWFDEAAGVVTGDPHRLQQVVWNLLSNAIKFTPAQGSVTVLLSRRSDAVEFSVTDTGEGIAEGFLPFVFDRFRQADASSTRVHGGLGLGLAIVKNLVELHGGHVAAHSRGEGKGATFIVCLPMNPAMASTPAQMQNDTGSTTLPPAAQPVGSDDLSHLRILVVDDEPDGRHIVQRILQDHGATVYAAGSAAEALDIVTRWHPDVMISDIGMPNVDGYELLRRVRLLGEMQGGDLPAIALTAFARAEDRVKALNAGYLTHMAKPVEPARLASLVAHALDHAPQVAALGARSVSH